MVLIVRLLALSRLSGTAFFLPTRGDMHFYNGWALRIVQGQWTDHVAFYGLPLYAYLLAGIYKFFGYNPFIPGLLQGCLEAGSAVLLYKTALRVFSGARAPNQSHVPYGNRAELIGLMAALSWAFFVPAQAYSVVLMPTVWLVFVFWFVVWQVVRAEPALTPLRCAFLGALIGFAAMGIATILFLIPLIAAALISAPT
ncbi:MAG: hypothetical protein ABI871_07185 [Chthoniobacterales bacterium]